MTAGALSRQTAEALAAVSDCAQFEARCLLAHFFSLSLNDIYLDKELGEPNLSELNQAVEKRLQHFPLQYILGEWEFMGSSFLVNENVLIPRPETELLCECLANKIDKNSVVFDVCAGTGCIAVSIAKMTGAKVIAIEKYGGALEVLKKNIEQNGAASVQAVQWDIETKPAAPIPVADVILSNPPYIESAAVKRLQQEVLCEPRTALDGGEDGYHFYRAIQQNVLAFLKPGGYAAFEIGEGQEEAIKHIFSAYRHIKTISDYNGIDRVVIFRKEPI